jgi:hypothetical protein
VNQIDVIEDEGATVLRPFSVKVNGKILLRKDGQERRFDSSINAAIAGAKEVDRLRASQSDRPETSGEANADRS